MQATYYAALCNISGFQCTVCSFNGVLGRQPVLTNHEWQKPIFAVRPEADAHQRWQYFVEFPWSPMKTRPEHVRRV